MGLVSLPCCKTSSIVTFEESDPISVPIKLFICYMKLAPPAAPRAPEISVSMSKLK